LQNNISRDKARLLYHDLDILAGAWDEAAAAEFKENSACFEQVDHRLLKILLRVFNSFNGI